MIIIEDTHARRVDSYAATDSFVSTGKEAEPRTDNGKMRGRAGVQFVATPRAQSIDKSHNIKVFEESVIDRRLAASFKVVHQRRDRLIGQRVSVLNQRIENEYHRNAIADSTVRVENAAKALLTRLGLCASELIEFQDLQQAVRESIDFTKTMEGMEAKLQETTRLLNSKETELYEKESRVYEQLAEITGFSSPPPSKWQKPPQPPQSTSSKSSAITDPHARRYYSRAGDAKILRERIHNMQVQHRHDLLRRQNGHVGKIPERLFRERFDRNLSSLLEELERAKKEAFLMKLACQRRHIPLEDDEESNQNILDAQYEDDRRVLSTFAGNGGPSKSLAIANMTSVQMDFTTKIRRWLKAMPHDIDSMEPELLNEIVDDRPASPDSTTDDMFPASSGVPSPERHAPMPIDTADIAEAFAKGNRRAFSITSLNSLEDDTSLVTGAAHTFSDCDISNAYSTLVDRERRYSDPGLERRFWLKPDIFHLVLGSNKVQSSQRPRRNSH
ncbi:hypothetical protein FKW77_004722 [Venturia effusa]|uniref:Uncharacterized protein n=1 Tax=Venturia effusa TaxID=50376 RepID=A0A517L189_9PEZI|nr:hypothetical protein FKW77_004722 [Venturia effusa]